MQCLDSGSRDRTLAALIDASCFGLLDTLALPLFSQVGFEFGESCEQVEHESTVRTAGVNRTLLERSEPHAFGGEPVDDLPEVRHRTGKAIQASDKESVPLANIVNTEGKLVAALLGGSALLFFKDFDATRSQQLLPLKLQ